MREEEEEGGGKILQVITPLTQRRPSPEESPLDLDQSRSPSFPEGRKKPPSPDLPGCILARQGRFFDFTFLDRHQFHILGKMRAIYQLPGYFEKHWLQRV